MNKERETLTEKRVEFEWEFGKSTVSLYVGEYAYGGLYIGMTDYDEGWPEPFADMTVNLPGYYLDPNEAFINGDLSKDLIRFIKKNKLGKVLPFEGKSGYGKYKAVEFDMEKLREFDPKGVEKYLNKEM